MSTATDNRARGRGSRTYRDATITKQTRDHLADLLVWLDKSNIRPWNDAVRDVVERWDANEATQVRL